MLYIKLHYLSTVMISANLLIIDDNKSDLNLMKDILKNEVRNIVSISLTSRIYEILAKKSIDIVLLDMNFNSRVNTGNEGLFWIREILKKDSSISIIPVTANGNIEQAVEAIREGAIDFIQKPFNRAKLVSVVNLAWNLRMAKIEASELKKDNQRLKIQINKGGEKLIQGASPTMINVMNIVRKVASTDANVLITGENGTGKELVAKEIHRLSKRSEELMVSVDLGSLTETLFESELFGHVKGAFTDAAEDRKGRFEQASGSTLFLDEIGNLSLRSQSKLLSVLQSRQIIRVGSNKPVPVNIRLICATNRNLGEMVIEGSFREDLFYRVNTIMIEVPPLRDRVDDIPILANHFLKINGERYGKPGLKLNTHALEKLSNHSWPGNVRELQHSIEKAVILSDSNILKPSDFVFTSKANSISGDMTLDEMEKQFITYTMRKYHSNLSLAANKLGITRQTLYNKLRKYDIS
ncbi:MAG TPA: sigma-54 dependent transcriptional regulator [Bacteroidales bacterium]|nr:sigma-54 dependent transcriptional regulator [Bacteroidales bacterium]